MTPSHRAYGVVILALIVTVLCSCAASRPQQQFAMSFLPAPLPAATTPDQPMLPSGLYGHSMPNLAQKTLPDVEWPGEADSRILKAEQHFDAGKKLYQRGERDAARVEFDAAIEALMSAPEDMPNRQKLDRKLDQLVDRIYRYDRDGLGAGENRDAVIFDKSPIDGILEMTFPADPNMKPRVQEEIQATVSQLPLEVNDPVLSYIHYFSSERGRRTIIAGLRRAGRYKALIQRILDEEGVPQELIYLAQAESGFMPRAVSYKQAEGMWQFVQFRGRQYGLMQTAQSDDRLDPEKATRAAARHLRDLYTHFGDWYLAMAAYNCGPGCVDKAIQRTGFADFWELRNRDALPKQTENYVPAILAITIMAKNPKDYGLEEVDPDQPVEYDTLALTSPTNLSLIADAADRPVSELRDLNPAVLRQVAPAGYEVRIPKGTASAVAAALENVPAERRLSWRMHRVERGETLTQIAKAFNTQAASIAQANSRIAEGPEAGDLLVIPVAYHPETAGARHAPAKRAGGRAAARYSTAPRSHKAMAAHGVPDHVLHRRAPVKTLKTASLRGPRSSD